MHRSGEEYICIGGCSAAWSDIDPDKSGNERSTGINGFVGEIAKVTILPDAVSAAEARAMAQAENMDDNNDPILDLVIDDKGNVSNGSIYGPAISSTDISGTEKVVDAENKNITFNGNQGSSSDYKFPTKNIAADLADGFSFELMFKVTSDKAYWTNGYMGVLDYEQLGGFGLMVKDEGTSGNGYINIFFEIAFNDTSVERGYNWKSITFANAKISTDEEEYWYHCVGSYDAKTGTVSFYVNGTFVGSVEMPTGFHDTTFYDTDPYISIGACAGEVKDTKSQDSIYGFDGSISVCRIYSKPVTAEQAAEMYQKATA